ncbi:tRNA adenosine(34) deaminase TadA [Biformimicrobium ophioploci]|uniref:tRNA-specific adenosine deaminase n=1 Tax=Biformimicrobium ophioploci TaxID=3036711 RepID=A0ABQ6LZC2_9GAMM|nr:tRNA adenosine(34) deaminase TadA [Microbulbifer sp. NKW57]GMG87409.1 tRNA adenosine(34) deaminase TadA [Microbulbifer sp. NKW57]
MARPIDFDFMERALELARTAANHGEVPVGAVVTLDDEIIGEGWNQPIISKDPTAHAEVVALRAAAQRLQNYRMPAANLYVSIEPCSMCCGAMIHARVKKLFYGAPEPRAGVVQSNLQMPEQPFYNHRLECEGGLLAEEAGEMLSAFFKSRR